MPASRSKSASSIRAGLVEGLEGRRLFSSATLSAAKTLTVAGDATLADKITVAESADGKSITVAVAATAHSAAVSKSFVTSGVLKLVVHGGAAADSILVGQTGHAFGIKTTVDAGKGNDTVKTGAEIDSISGGDGNDTILAGGGNDVVHGDGGDDNVHGGDGNDTLYGSNGKDSLFGEAGDDTLGGVLGVNYGIGGTGKDTFLVKNTLAGSFYHTDFSAGDKVVKSIDDA